MVFTFFIWYIFTPVGLARPACGGPRKEKEVLGGDTPHPGHGTASPGTPS